MPMRRRAPKPQLPPAPGSANAVKAGADAPAAPVRHLVAVQAGAPPPRRPWPDARTVHPSALPRRPHLSLYDPQAQPRDSSGGI